MCIQNIDTNKVNKQPPEYGNKKKTSDYDNNSSHGWASWKWNLNWNAFSYAFAQSSHSGSLNAYNLIRHFELNTLSCHDLIWFIIACVHIFKMLILF